MFRKVLVANRGEIALRIIHACRSLGIGTVAGYSSAGADSLPAAALADQAVHIGPPQGPPYPRLRRIIAAAQRTGADAIHPGYGFLASDPDFARICVDNGIAFIGPPPDVLNALGDRVTARRLMGAAGLPLLPGSAGALGTVDQAVAAAEDVGFPVVITASGGRGRTVVHRREYLPGAYRAARENARAAARNPAMYLEKYLCSARHLEVRVLCDNYGTGIHLGERDSTAGLSATVPAMDAVLRARMGAAAVRGALAVGYRGAGTVEFLMDADDRFWFTAMTPRVQLGHSFTEPIGPSDLIAEQLRIAAGSPLSFGQEDIRPPGPICPVEVDQSSDGRMSSGGIIPLFYDSMIAKLIVWTPDRADMLDRMRRILGESGARMGFLNPLVEPD